VEGGRGDRALSRCPNGASEKPLKKVTRLRPQKRTAHHNGKRMRIKVLRKEKKERGGQRSQRQKRKEGKFWAKGLGAFRDSLSPERESDPIMLNFHKKEKKT